jgi:uncharacterized membrane protein
MSSPSQSKGYLELVSLSFGILADLLMVALGILIWKQVLSFPSWYCFSMYIVVFATYFISLKLLKRRIVKG